MIINYTDQYQEVVSNGSVVRYVYPEYKATVMLREAWSPCILLIGGFGNVATIFVLRRTKGHNSSHHVFLIALALADLTVLWSYVLPVYVWYSFEVKMWAVHSAACKLLMFIRTVAFRLSAWLVTAVTIQRTMAIKWPHKIRVMCTVRRTWTVVAALACVACAISGHILVLWDIYNNDCGTFGSRSYRFFIRYVSPWLNLSLGAFLPFVCLLVCDVILSLSLFRATSATSVANQAISNVSSVQSNNSRRETARRTTVMILALSISFFILALPIRINIMWFLFMRDEKGRDPKWSAMMLLMNTVGWLLVSTNSAINFFLYCLTGTRFRKEFLNWIRCRGGDPSSGVVRKTASGSSRKERSKHHDSTHGSRLTGT